MSRFIMSMIFGLIGAATAWGASLPASEWSLARYQGAQASYDGGLVSISNSGTDFWHVQLTHTGIELLNGHTYQASFSVKSIEKNRSIEVRIGRNGPPYDAFAEFGDLYVTTTSQTLTKIFSMEKESTNDARFEFNAGKYLGNVFISDVSVVCTDCSSSSSSSSESSGNGGYSISESTMGLLLSADTVVLSDYSKTLGGSVYGNVLELGADSKVHGSVGIGKKCNLRERAQISGTLTSPEACNHQNGIIIGTEIRGSTERDATNVGMVTAGSRDVYVEIGSVQDVFPGAYKSLYINARSKITLRSGEYVFSSVYSEPDVKLNFDLSDGPIIINVVNGVRLADRNVAYITGGNPSEIEWRVASGLIDLGTDGKYFGRFIAPKSGFRIAPRTHLIGGVVAQHFLMEPQSTLSMEPRAEEISHSEYNFGPFYSPNAFRYHSTISPAVNELAMFVYANGLGIKVNGNDSRNVKLVGNSQNIAVKLTRALVDGFPAEAFSSQYTFSFNKNPNNRIYWNPQSSCESNCNGNTVATAFQKYETAKEQAEITGKELVMTGGSWNTYTDYVDGVVEIPVGFELIGFERPISSVTDISNVPAINFGGKNAFSLKGRSPRQLIGLRFINGNSSSNGGGLKSQSQHLSIDNSVFSGNVSLADGGAIYHNGDSLTLNGVMFNGNSANASGGAVYTSGECNFENVIFSENRSKENAGALYLDNVATVRNGVFYLNNAENQGGAIFHGSNSTSLIINATVFKNYAGNGYSGIGGTGTSEIYNSIFWKNASGVCGFEMCQKDISTTYSVHHVLADTQYAGESNITENPLFKDETNPAGTNNFLGIDAGVTLQDGSPAIKKGIRDDRTPIIDVLGSDRGMEVDLGAYCWYENAGAFKYGAWSHGKFTSVTPARPIIENLPSERWIEFFGHAKFGRVIKRLVRKHDKTRISKAIVRITLLDASGNAYNDVGYVDVPFYRIGEEDGKYVFQSLIHSTAANDYDPSIHGRLVIFTSDLAKIGVHDDIIVLPVKNITDMYHYEVVQW